MFYYYGICERMQWTRAGRHDDDVVELRRAQEASKMVVVLCAPSALTSHK
jgi:hypothetical protein